MEAEGGGGLRGVTVRFGNAFSTWRWNGDRRGGLPEFGKKRERLQSTRMRQRGGRQKRKAGDVKKSRVRCQGEKSSGNAEHPAMTPRGPYKKRKRLCEALLLL